MSVLNSLAGPLNSLAGPPCFAFLEACKQAVPVQVRMLSLLSYIVNTLSVDEMQTVNYLLTIVLFEVR